MLPVAPYQGTLPIFEKSFWRSDVWPEIDQLTSCYNFNGVENCPQGLCIARLEGSAAVWPEGMAQMTTWLEIKVSAKYSADTNGIYNTLTTGSIKKCLLVSKSVSNVRTTPPPWSPTSIKHSNHLQISIELFRAAWDERQQKFYPGTKPESAHKNSWILLSFYHKPSKPTWRWFPGGFFTVFSMCLFCDFHPFTVIYFYGKMFATWLYVLKEGTVFHVFKTKLKTTVTSSVNPNHVWNCTTWQLPLQNLKNQQARRRGCIGKAAGCR